MALDCFVGQPTRFTDINGVARAFTYGTTTDARMDKLIKTTRAQGTTEEAATNYEYGLTLATGVYVETRSALRTAADDLLKARQVFDGLGRGTEERQWNGSAWVITKREYDGAHRVKRVSNPTSMGAYVYTVTDYDAMGRPVLVTAPDGAKTTYEYALHETTGGRSRRTKSITPLFQTRFWTLCCDSAYRRWKLTCRTAH